MNKLDTPKAREAAVFKSNRSQAVRIPKELAFPDTVRRVTITPVEGGLLIQPVVSGWAEYFAGQKGLDAESVEQMLAAVNNDPPPESVESLD